MKFLGIDLGWTSGESGLCCLVWDNQQLQILEIDRKQDVNDQDVNYILTWVDLWLPKSDPGAIAVQGSSTNQTVKPPFD